jgi:hypothetical protein
VRRARPADGREQEARLLNQSRGSAGAQRTHKSTRRARRHFLISALPPMAIIVVSACACVWRRVRARGVGAQARASAGGARVRGEADGGL